MKKILPMLIVGILVLGGLGAVARTESDNENLKSESVSFSVPIIQDKNEYISIELAETTYNSWESNKPMMPVITKVYMFDFGTTIDDVEVTFSDDIQQAVSKPIIPSPEVYMDSIEYAQNIEKSEKIVTYSDIDVYPNHRFSYKTGAGLNNEEHVIYLSVHLYPVQYHPKVNTISYSKSANINIKYTPPEKPFVFADDYDYLILAPADFESALQPLVDHKNQNEIDTILVTLDEIPSAGGYDEQEDIKYYIKDKIENWGITYVLLVGAGVEGEEIFPVRYAWIKSDEHEDYFPSDLYFADIYDEEGNFSDWDKDGNGKYAEYTVDMDNIDVIPDVYIARLPANNVKEINIVVDKIIWYDEHNKMTKKILQAGGDSFTSDSVNEGEYANEVVFSKLEPVGYTTTQLWGSNGKLTKGNFAKGFRSSVDFVDFCGHGSWASIATHPPKDKDTWIPPKTLISPYTGFLYLDFDIYMALNSKKFPICVYKSCSNNKFSDSETCFSWETVNKKNGGGIAAFGASGIGYGATGTDIVERTTGWMEVHTFEELISTKILGQVWGNDIRDYYNTFELGLTHTDWKTLLEWSMFGDPTIAAEDGDDPINIPTNVPVYNGFIGLLLERFPRLVALFENILAKLI